MLADRLNHLTDSRERLERIVSQPLPEAEVPRVFVVDDEWIIAETLATILNKGGFHAFPFHNSGQALVRALSSPPDILITDVMMPGMTGIELAIALRKEHPGCRILLFSGQSGALDLLCDARRRGYEFELLDKPLHPLQLLMRLRNTKLRSSAESAPTEPAAAAGSEPKTQPAA